jgi:hypothetical protein
MPRFSNIKDTLIEINKMNSQAGTCYRESGLVPWPKAEAILGIFNVSYLESYRTMIMKKSTL